MPTMHTNIQYFMYDPKGSGPYGVCLCVSYRAVLCTVHNVDRDTYLTNRHRRHCCDSTVAVVTLTRHTYLIRTLPVLFYVK